MNRMIPHSLLAALVCTTVSSAWALPDLTASWTPSGWSYPALPRSTPDAFSTGVPLQSPALPGNSFSTYWNTSAINLSQFDATLPCTHVTYLNDVPQVSNGPYVYQAGALGTFMNQGAPAPIKGGRHTMLSRADAFNNALEADESNNDWARQYIWSGLPLSADSPVTRTHDPFVFSTGVGPYWNSEGFQAVASGPSYWNVFAVMPETGVSSDFDMFLCTEPPLNVPQQGFGAAVAGSNQFASNTDFVIIDRNVVPNGTYYAAVQNWSGGANKVVEFDADQGTISNPGESSLYTLDPGEIVNMHEVYLFAGQRTRIQVRWHGGDSDVYVGLFNPSSGFAGSFDALATTSTVGLGFGNDAFVDYTAPSGGYHGIVVAKPNTESIGKSLQYTIVVSQQPNITRYAPLAWHGPIVPRSTNDSGPTYAPLPQFLDGNLPNTWLNFSSINQGPGTAPNFWTRLLLDDVALAEGFFVGDCPEGGFPEWMNTPQGGPGFSIRGGLHHFRTQSDMNNNVVEFPEYDNDFTDWFVWSPLDLLNQIPVVRAAPPIRYPLGGGPYESCDGFRSWHPYNGLWTAFAMIPATMSDEYDVRLHPVSAGSKNGFDNTLAWSADPWPGNPDFCIVNFNVAPFSSAIDASVTNWSGSANNFSVQRADSPYWGTIPPGLSRISSLALETHDCLDIHEFYFDGGVPYFISVNNIAGNVDLELFLFDGTAPYHTKASSITFTNANGPGADEHIGPITFATAGFHAVVVAKSKAFDFANTATYELVFSTGQSAVDAPIAPAAPTAFALSAPRPNPFADRATIELAVPQGKGHAAVAIYDLQGRRIAELASESTPGRHTLIWDGRDSTGRDVAAGVYFVRLEAAGVNETKKITLLR